MARYSSKSLGGFSFNSHKNSLRYVIQYPFNIWETWLRTFLKVMNLVHVRAGSYQRCSFKKNCCMDYSLLSLYLSMPWMQTTHGSEFQFVLLKKKNSRDQFLFALTVAPGSSGFCSVPREQSGSLSRLTCSSSSSEPRVLLSSSETSSCRAWQHWASLASVSPRILSCSLSSFSSFCSCLCFSSARKFFCCSNSAWILNLCVSTFSFGVIGKREVGFLKIKIS